MTAREVFNEVTSVYDNYVAVLETGSVGELQRYARDLSERIIPRGVETHEVVGIVLLLRDVLARSLFEKYRDEFALLHEVLDTYEPAANLIANTVAVSFVEERERVIGQQQDAIRDLSTPVADDDAQRRLPARAADLPGRGAPERPRQRPALSRGRGQAVGVPELHTSTVRLRTDRNGRRTGRHCTFLPHAHSVSVTKYRHRAFDHRHLRRLEEIMRAVCADFEAELVEFNDEANHVYLLVDLPPKIALPGWSTASRASRPSICGRSSPTSSTTTGARSGCGPAPTSPGRSPGHR